MSADPSRLDTTWSAGEEVLRRFEAAWGNATRPDLNDFLPPDGSHPTRLVAELAHVDLEFRLRAGEQARVEDYIARFPELGEPRLAVELIATEFGQRHRLGQTPAHDEYTARFPQYRDALAAVLSARGVAETRSSHRSGEGPPVGVPTIPGCRIGDELGRGGMGVVYHAYQPALSRAVAVKTFLAVPTQEAAERFSREAETVARLDHPHIVPIYEIGSWDANGRRVPYFVMKLYPGGNLDSTPCGPGTDITAHARTVEVVARAVHHAHRRGVLHRDLKPSNILRDEQGEPHVADFGLAGRFDPSAPRSVAGVGAGTPAFMAPEQAKQNARVTVAADVYGLGALLYHQLTGRPPFRAATAMATLDLLRSTAPVPPSKVNPAVPRDLEAVCLKCLSKEPAKRYATAEDVADDLDRWRTGRPVLARPTPAWEHAWRASRRHPLTAALTLTTVLAVAAVISMLAVSCQRVAGALDREKQATAGLTEALDREQRALYLERVVSAGQMYSVNHLGQASQLLRDCPPHLANWEHAYLTSALDRTPPPLGTHGWVSAVAFLADDRLVTTDINDRARVWDVVGRRELRSWPTERALTLTAHPTRPWFALAGVREVTVWDADTGEPVRKLSASKWAAFAPDGRTLAAADGPHVRLFDTTTWEPVRSLTCPADVLFVAFSHDGNLLAVSSIDRAVQLWNPHTGQPVGGPRKRPTPVRRLAFTADGKLLFEDRTNGSVQVTEAATGDTHETLNVGGGRTTVGVGPSPYWVAVTGPNSEVHLLHLTGRLIVRTFRGHITPPIALAFSRDGKRLASGGDSTVRVWDVDNSPDCREFPIVGNDLTGLAVARGGGRVAVVARSMVRASDAFGRVFAGDGRELYKVAGSGGVEFSPDGSMLATGRGGGVAVYAADTGAEKWTAGTGMPTTRVAFSPDGRTLAAGDISGGLRVWEAATGRAVANWKAPGAVYGLAFTPDGRQLVTANSNGFMLWDVDTQAVVWSVGSGGMAVAVSADGALLATADRDRVVRVREAATGAVVREFVATPTPTMGVAFSPDGQRLVSATERAVRVWDVATGRELLTLPGTIPNLSAVAWDGPRVYALDERVRVWSSSP